MYKIAILGCENIHADACISIVKEKKAVSDIEFIGVYSDEPEAMQKLNDTQALSRRSFCPCLCR